MESVSMSIDTSQLVCNYWERHAKEHPQSEALIHWDALDKPFRWTYSALFQEALSVADDLLARGVKQRDICALIMRHNKYFYPVYMGISLIGAIPTVLAYPNTRLHPDKFVFGITGIAQKSDINWVITEKELDSIITPLIIHEKSLVKGVLLPLEWGRSSGNRRVNDDKIREMRNGITPDMPLLLQFSSGTTGLQKGILMSHKSVLEHVKRYGEAIQMNERDKFVSWLPLYHDMGLIATIYMPLVNGLPTIQIDPFQWVSAPVIFFQAISDEKATLTWIPNFVFNFMADRIREEEMENVDLSSMRMYITAGEVVRYESLEKFFRRFQKYGVRKKSLTVMYGMAETALAVTQTEPDTEVSDLELDREALSKKMIKPPQKSRSKKICVSSGKPISGCSLKIIDEKGNELPEDRIGSILVQSASLFEGYLKNPEATRKVRKNGWYLTGDFGFCHKGEYYVLGREDDVIIVAGKNIYPEDIEDAVNQVKGVIPGRLVAFGIDDPETGTQKVCLVVETLYEDEDRKESLRLEIMQAGMGIDVTISSIYCVPSRWLIKSSSGKISRKTNRDRILKNMEIQSEKKQ